MQRANCSPPTCFSSPLPRPAVPAGGEEPPAAPVVVCEPRLATPGLPPRPPQPAATTAAPATSARPATRNEELTPRGIVRPRLRGGDERCYPAVTWIGQS